MAEKEFQKEKAKVPYFSVFFSSFFSLHFSLALKYTLKYTFSLLFFSRNGLIIAYVIFPKKSNRHYLLHKKSPKYGLTFLLSYLQPSKPSHFFKVVLMLGYFSLPPPVFMTLLFSFVRSRSDTIVKKELRSENRKSAIVAHLTKKKYIILVLCLFWNSTQRT